MRNLASTARLNLILKQNAAMAHAAAEWKRMHSPEAMKVFPYVRYHASGDNRTRDAHARLDGMIFAKDDPFLSTHTPPWEFNCRCYLEEITEKEAGRTPELIQEPTPADQVTVDSESGFSFDPAHAFEEFDLSSIKDAELRGRAAEGLKRSFACKISDDGLLASAPGTDETQKVKIRDQSPGPKVREAVKQLGSVRGNGTVDFSGMPESAAGLVRKAADRIAERMKEYGLSISYVGTNAHSKGEDALSAETVFETRGPSTLTGRTELIFNVARFANPGQLKFNMSQDERNGFHPKGCSTIAAYADHEISHFLFYAARMEEDAEFMRYMRKLKSQPILVRDKISGYAANYTSGDDVTFAQEALAECFMSVKQHPLFPPKKHKEIVNMLEKRLKQSKLK